jgi:signal transduction histidine kinase
MRRTRDLSLPIEYPLFVVFKEAVNNVARHSGATEMNVRLAVTDGVLSLLVEIMVPVSMGTNAGELNLGAG